MSVLAEAISVIVPVQVLVAKYPGGATAYEHDCPNDSYCSDGNLTRVGFTSAEEVQNHVRRLQNVGLTLVEESGGFADLAVVDQLRGPLTQCKWIEYWRHPERYAICWLHGARPGVLAYPEHWRLDGSIAKTYSFTSVQVPGLDVGRDTGEESEPPPSRRRLLLAALINLVLGFGLGYLLARRSRPFRITLTLGLIGAVGFLAFSLATLSVCDPNDLGCGLVLGGVSFLFFFPLFILVSFVSGLEQLAFALMKGNAPQAVTRH